MAHAMHVFAVAAALLFLIVSVVHAHPVYSGSDHHRIKRQFGGFSPYRRSAQGLGFGSAAGRNAVINSNSFSNTGIFGGGSAGGTSFGRASGPGHVFTVAGGQTGNASAQGVSYVDRRKK